MNGHLLKLHESLVEQLTDQEASSAPSAGARMATMGYSTTLRWGGFTSLGGGGFTSSGGGGFTSSGSVVGAAAPSRPRRAGAASPPRVRRAGAVAPSRARREGAAAPPPSPASWMARLTLCAQLRKKKLLDSLLGDRRRWCWGFLGVAVDEVLG
jgi:hypothetical protein